MFGGALLAAGGCSTAGVVAGAGAGESSTYILADSKSLADRVIVAAVERDMVGDLMRAHVTLKSARDRTLHIQYKFSWFDAAGVEIDPGSKPYRDLILEGRDGASITSIAPSPDAKEFKIRICNI